MLSMVLTPEHTLLGAIYTGDDAAGGWVHTEIAQQPFRS